MTAKQPSRAARWSEACLKAQMAMEDVRAALEEVDEIRQEYEEWRDNLPENAQSGATWDKLEEVACLDVLGPLEDIESTIEDCAAADLPIGYGRD